MEGAKVIIYIFVSVWLHVNKSSWVFKGAGEVNQDLVCDHHHHGTAKKSAQLINGIPTGGRIDHSASWRFLKAVMRGESEWERDTDVERNTVR